jgi:hypothetical protein
MHSRSLKVFLAITGFGIIILDIKIIKAGINIYKVRYKDSGSVYNR